MKNFTGFAVIIILFILPAGSYWYLKSGFDYRKAQLKEIQEKGAFLDFAQASDAVGERLKGSLEDKVAIVQVIKDSTIDTIVPYKIKDQFKNNTHFSFLKVNEAEISIQPPYHDSEYFLINNGQLLNSYSGSEQSIKDMMAQTAVTLPIERRKKIKLKRQLSKDEEPSE